MDDNSVLSDFSHASPSQATQSNKRPRSSSKSSSVSSTRVSSPGLVSSGSTQLKEMAVDALRSLSESKPKDKFSALGEYIAAELQSLTPAQAQFAKSKLSRAFNDIVDEAIEKVGTICV